MSCLFMLFIRGHFFVVVCMMLGKMCVTAVWNVLFIYAAELYLPACRGRGLSLCAVVGRIGSLIAPLVSNGLSLRLTYAVFGSAALAAALVPHMLLPETRGSAAAGSTRDSWCVG